MLLGALLTHIIINNFGLEYGDRIGYITILWLAALAISFNMILYSFSKKYKDGWDDAKRGEFDIVGINGKKTDKRIYIEKKGIVSDALVEGVSKNVMGQNFAVKAVICMITYSFVDKDGNKIKKIKKYNDQVLYNFPKVGDKIKIIYDESNSDDSVILHEEVNQEIKWNKLKQKKYTITIINSIK